MWGFSIWGHFTWGPILPAYCNSRASCSVTTRCQAMAQPIVQARSSALLIGNVVQLDFQVLGGLGWVDPGSVALFLKPPSGANIAPSPTKLGPGRYRYNLSTTGLLTGLWRYRWEGTGAYECAAEGEFEIIASEVI